MRGARRSRLRDVVRTKLRRARERFALARLESRPRARSGARRRVDAGSTTPRAPAPVNAGARLRRRMRGAREPCGSDPLRTLIYGEPVARPVRRNPAGPGQRFHRDPARTDAMIEAAVLWNEPNNKSHWDPEVDPDWSLYSAMTLAAGRA